MIPTIPTPSPEMRELVADIFQLISKAGYLSGQPQEAAAQLLATFCAAREQAFKVGAFNDDQLIKSLRAALADLRAQLAAAQERATQLDAWENVFGTSQLTHAIARLEVAEKGAAAAQEDSRRLRITHNSEGFWLELEAPSQLQAAIYLGTPKAIFSLRILQEFAAIDAARQPEASKP